MDATSIPRPARPELLKCSRIAESRTTKFRGTVQPSGFWRLSHATVLAVLCPLPEHPACSPVGVSRSRTSTVRLTPTDRGVLSPAYPHVPMSPVPSPFVHAGHTALPNTYSSSSTY
ncbi:hypothetical protein OH76DRAFT_515572 [Lentinus brumalis]|uniref:Uncharacterized protein n=1 Tax=Lentinus brumalis TaxID=2498619 RepID=A0A371CHT7_9APHY|nr:hypothetical protein OH76DRAFT_515572 [Polyporus brumalis]